MYLFPLLFQHCSYCLLTCRFANFP